MNNFLRSICLILFFLQYTAADHAFTQTAIKPTTQLPEPMRIKFAKGETAFTMKDHIAVGEKSKRYVLKALQGQTMRVIISGRELSIDQGIVGQDGTVLKYPGFYSYKFFKEQLPKTQDYFIELKRVSYEKDQDFILLILVNPVEQASPWFTYYEGYEQKLINLFPNKYDSGTYNTNPYIPTTYSHLLSIPFHNIGKILRVYSVKPCSFDPSASYQNFDCIYDNGEVHLTSFDPARSRSTYLGAIQRASYSGNSGGIFMPFALTKDDHNIILDAWMGSPGAGGGMQDYGYAMIPVKEASESTVYSDFAQIATRESFFYDNFGKVVYLGNSDKMPQYQQPGPRYNNGALYFRNLITNKVSTILEEENTTFDLVAIDIRVKRIILIATKYLFTDGCPKDDVGYYCAEKIMTIRTISLP